MTGPLITAETIDLCRLSISPAGCWCSYDDLSGDRIDVGAAERAAAAVADRLAYLPMPRADIARASYLAGLVVGVRCGRMVP